MSTEKIVALLLLALAASGCRMLGGKPSPEGLAEVKSVGKGADDWKDARGAMWRLYEAKPLDWEDARSHCAELAKSSKKRWRLPAPAELVKAREDGISTKSNTAFGWVTLGNVWAAEWETAVDEDVAGVFVNMADGSQMRTVYDDLEHATVCVRTDGKGDEWDDGKGHHWHYIEVRMPFETAQVTCAELARRRHEGWRLPSPEELAAAISDGIQSDANKAFGSDYLTFVWSGNVAPLIDSEQAFAVDLRNGHSHMTDIDADLTVICIR